LGGHYTDFLVVNELEEREIRDAGPELSERLGKIAVVTTLGGKGARYCAPDNAFEAAAYSVEAVDTTGAGNTFPGYLLAALDAGEIVENAIRGAMAAVALKVTRIGTSSAIPTQAEVSDFLTNYG